MDFIDEPAQIRQGEELDIKRVEEYLRDTIPGLSGELTIEQFPSGFSNLTYLISVGRKSLVLRRPPFGHKAKSAHDMGREYRVLSALHPVFPYCPKPLAYTEDETVIGCPFYVMERIHGIILRKHLPKGLNLTPGEMKALCENLIDVHCRLHSVDYKEIGLEGFGKPEGYVKRQVEGWSQRFRAAHTPDAPTFENAMSWLYERMPSDFSRPSIIHNDYKFDNVVLNPHNPLEIIGVLDWEMATIGDPLMDLGNSLGYWVQANDPPNIRAAAMMPTNVPGALTREGLVERYAEKAGITIDDFSFYYYFGVFRIAVIMQQIYYRYYYRQTRDERFKVLIFAIHIISDEFDKLIARTSG